VGWIVKTEVLVVERVMIVEVVLIQVLTHFVCHDHDYETDRCDHGHDGCGGWIGGCGGCECY
jgi:hypothetical protein